MQGVHDLYYSFIVARSTWPPPYWTARASSDEYDAYIITQHLHNTNEGGHRHPQILNDHRLGLRLRSLSDP